MVEDLESKIPAQPKPEISREIFDQLNHNLFRFKNEVQLEVIKHLSQNEQIKEISGGLAAETGSSAADFDTYIADVVVELSPLLREKIIEYLLSGIFHSQDPRDLFKINDNNLEEFVSGEDREKIINKLVDFVLEKISQEQQKQAA